MSSFGSSDERDEVKGRVERLEAAARLLQAVRADPMMLDYSRPSTEPNLPAMPLSRELMKAAAVLDEVAACLRHIHDRRCRPGDDVPLGQRNEGDLDETPF